MFKGEGSAVCAHVETTSSKLCTARSPEVGLEFRVWPKVHAASALVLADNGTTVSAVCETSELCCY